MCQTSLNAGKTQRKRDSMSSKGSNALAATENVRSIRDCIFTIRGVQVMLDRDLAAIYQVSTSAFNQAVKRNIGRFPPEFRFQLTREEHRFLMSQIVISKRADGLETRGGVQKLPYAFTEQGIAMLSGVLKSEVAVQTSIKLMNTFVAMRKTLATMAPVLARIEANEAKFNAQYGGLTVRTSAAFHDRFLVIDDKELYLIGASLKDLGKKCFGFTKMDAGEIAGLKKRI